MFEYLAIHVPLVYDGVSIPGYPASAVFWLVHDEWKGYERNHSWFSQDNMVEFFLGIEKNYAIPRSRHTVPE